MKSLLHKIERDMDNPNFLKDHLKPYNFETDVPFFQKLESRF